MSFRRPIRKQPSLRSQSGYALLMVVFLAALMTIATAVAAPNLLIQNQREKEEEMIWRGEQYTRAIRAFYRKNGRFPQSLEDLTEKKVGNLRYLRNAYKEVMNKEDGTWRLIYIGPGGQLIGSVTRTAAIQLGPAPGQIAGGGQPGKGPGPAPLPRPAPAGTSGLSGPVIGGNIIGVGSKVDRVSLKVYQGRQTYREWEFLWDPSKDAAIVGVPGAVTPGGGVRPTQQPQPQPPRP